MHLLIMEVLELCDMDLRGEWIKKCKNLTSE
jgi:hypothetical protein